MRNNPTRPLWRTLAASAAALLLAAPALAQITLYGQDGFNGRSITVQDNLRNLERVGFNDRASSAVVRGGRWEICPERGFRGNCRVLRPGQYASLSAMGLDDRVSSVRRVTDRARVDDERYSPPPAVAYDYRRRDRERLFEAPVRDVRAVYGEPQQRCWVEREQVTSERGDARVPGAIFGAVIGGILGHQIGGRGLPTAGGAVAGAVVGSNLAAGGGGTVTSTRDVQRCREVPGSAQPTYWDVTYEFRGRQYQVQMTSAPGPTVTVNRQGEPRA